MNLLDVDKMRCDSHIKRRRWGRERKGREGELVLEMTTNKRIVTQSVCPSVRQPAKWVTVSTSGRNERSISHLRYCKGGE